MVWRNEKDIIRIEKWFGEMKKTLFVLKNVLIYLVIYVISMRKMKINANNEIFNTKNALER